MKEKENKIVLIIIIIFLAILLPFPINYHTYCSSNEIDLEMTNLLVLIFGYPHCYEYEIGKLENMPRGYCQEHNYTGWRYNFNSSVEDCIVFAHSCEIKHSWWWFLK